MCTCTHVHAHVHMYMHTYALCGYTRHLHTCRYAAILVNRPSGISQAAAFAVNRMKGVKAIENQKNMLFDMVMGKSSEMPVLRTT